MTNLLIAASFWNAHIWYAVPLGVVISLVYGATRHEDIPEIMRQSWHAAVWVTVFLGVIALLVWLGGFGVG
jgi:hypothetical protein